VLSDNRKYRKFTSKQKVELVLASFRGDRSIAELCREHDRRGEPVAEVARAGGRDPDHISGSNRYSKLGISRSTRSRRFGLGAGLDDPANAEGDVVTRHQ
jgi:hypothetical protein